DERSADRIRIAVRERVLGGEVVVGSLAVQGLLRAAGRERDRADGREQESNAQNRGPNHHGGGEQGPAQHGWVSQHGGHSNQKCRRTPKRKMRGDWKASGLPKFGFFTMGSPLTSRWVSSSCFVPPAIGTTSE